MAPPGRIAVPGVQWLANVEAAGGCRVRMGGRWVVLTAPRRFHDPSRRSVPWIVRVALWVLRVDEFVELLGASPVSRR